MKPCRKKTTRCAAVAKVEKIVVSRTTTGGLFGTVDMKRVAKGKGYPILHLLEMLDGECTAYKRAALVDMRSSHMKVAKYCHDCACVVGPDFEGSLCTRTYLDGYHSKGHKCNWRTITHHPVLNSSAAEQLWSRLDKFSWVCEMPRAHYRYFWYCYCRWRNAYVRSAAYTNDTTPLASCKRLKRHGKK